MDGPATASAAFDACPTIITPETRAPPGSAPHLYLDGFQSHHERFSYYRTKQRLPPRHAEWRGRASVSLASDPVEIWRETGRLFGYDLCAALDAFSTLALWEALGTPSLSQFRVVLMALPFHSLDRICQSMALGSPSDAAQALCADLFAGLSAVLAKDPRAAATVDPLRAQQAREARAYHASYRHSPPRSGGRSALFAALVGLVVRDVFAVMVQESERLHIEEGVQALAVRPFSVALRLSGRERRDKSPLTLDEVCTGFATRVHRDVGASLRFLKGEDAAKLKWESAPGLAELGCVLFVREAVLT